MKGTINLASDAIAITCSEADGKVSVAVLNKLESPPASVTKTFTQSAEQEAWVAALLLMENPFASPGVPMREFLAPLYKDAELDSIGLIP